MYFFMNTRVPPFTSLKVRRAVNYAISRRWLKHLAGGLARGTQNILPPGYPSFRPLSLYRHDLRKAIRLVRESGYGGRRSSSGTTTSPQISRSPTTSSRC